jgi:hypothetical protein
MNSTPNSMESPAACREGRGEHSESEETDSTRRSLFAALLGAAGAATLTGCGAEANGERPWTTGVLAEALAKGTESISGVDNVLGAAPQSGLGTLGWDGTNPRTGVLATADNSATGVNANVVVVEGCLSPGDGGGGIFYWDSTGGYDDGGTFIRPTTTGIPVATFGAGWRRVRDMRLSVLWFGAKGDDNASTDCTAAFQNAIATGHIVEVPFGTYKLTSTLTLDTGGLVGEGWGTGPSAQKAKLLFYNLTSSTSSAIRTRRATAIHMFPRLENLYIWASSWDAATGCSGYGLDIEASIIVRNVFVGGFKVNNLFLHGDSSGSGPYESLFENFVSQYAGQHGIVVGTGANTITFINLQSKWCGAPSHSTAPSAAGFYDGFIILRDGVGNPGSAYYSYVPESVRVIGGDCSYNSRYGWNFSQAASCFFQPGYAEGNLLGAPGQVNLGVDLQHCYVIMTGISGSGKGVNFAANYNLYLPTNSIFVNGQSYGSGDNNTKCSNFLVANQTTYVAYKSDFSSAAYMNAEPSTGNVELNVVGTAIWNFGNVDIYRSGTKVVGVRRTGYTNAMTGTAERATTLATSTVTLQQLAQRVKALEDDLIAHGLIGP